MDLFGPLKPPTSISAANYQEAVRLFGNGDNRAAAYAFLFKLTGNMAFLIEAKVSSASGAFVGGPAWTFNAMLQSVMSAYPQDNAAIKQFSIEIGASVLASIQPDPNNPGQYIVPAEPALYDAAVSVWDSKNLAGVSPPAFMKAWRLFVNGDVAGAYAAASHNSAPSPDGIAVGAINDPMLLFAESQRINAEAVAYTMTGLGSAVAKAGTTASGLIGDVTGFTRSGNFILDLLKSETNLDKFRFDSLGYGQWALEEQGADGSWDKVLGVFDAVDVRFSEGSLFLAERLSIGYGAAPDALLQAQQQRADIESRLASIIPAELMYYAGPAGVPLLPYTSGVDVHVLPGGIQTYEGRIVTAGPTSDLGMVQQIALLPPNGAPGDPVTGYPVRITIAPTEDDRLVLTYQFLEQKQTAIVTLSKDLQPVGIPVSRFQWVDTSGSAVEKEQSTGFVVSVGDGAGASRIVQNLVGGTLVNATYSIQADGSASLDRVNSIGGRALSSDESTLATDAARAASLTFDMLVNPSLVPSASEQALASVSTTILDRQPVVVVEPDFSGSGPLTPKIAVTDLGNGVTRTTVRDANGVITGIKEVSSEGDSLITRFFSGSGEFLGSEVRKGYADGSFEITTSSQDGSSLHVVYAANGAIVSSIGTNPPLQTFGTAIQDINSLIQAIRSGQPLPILNSGLTLLNNLANPVVAGTPTISNQPLYTASAAVSAISSLYALHQAFSGDGSTLDQISASANSLVAVNSLANAVATELSGEITTNALGALSSVANTVGQAIPFLNAAVALENGDYLGAAVAVASFFCGPIGWIYAAYSIISALSDDPPEAWGTARFKFSTGTTVTVDTVGESIGLGKVDLLTKGNGLPPTLPDGSQNPAYFGGLLGYLKSVTDQALLLNPSMPLGIIPQRLPVLNWREARKSHPGYSLVEIDPVTGQERYPGLLYNDDFTPYNADPLDPAQRRDVFQRMVDSALARQAIAPMWEVRTARMQQDVGDPDAGLTEEERAAHRGLSAPADADGNRLPGKFRPVLLDLNGDGKITTLTEAQSSVSFDWDDSGFDKQTGWAGAGEGFLVLDRNLNGIADSGRELFSNGLLSDAAKGVRGLAWVDANADGVLDASDPVFAALQVWQDANLDGIQSASETKTLAQLNITKIDYGSSRFTRNGQEFSLQSPDLETTDTGVRVNVVQGGIQVNYSTGQSTLFVTQVTDLGGGSGQGTNFVARDDGFTLWEDGVSPGNTGDPNYPRPQQPSDNQPISILLSQLLANDTYNGSGAGLSVTGVANSAHGTAVLNTSLGVVSFTPQHDFVGQGTFDYTVTGPGGLTRTAKAIVTLQAVNDAPAVSSTLDQHAVYGYGVLAHTTVVGGEDGYTEVTVERDKGIPLYQPFNTVSGQLITYVLAGEGGYDTYGPMTDSGISKEYFDRAYAQVLAQQSGGESGSSGVTGVTVVMDGLKYFLPATPTLYLHNTPIGTEIDNNGQIVATDADGPGNFRYDLAVNGDGLYGHVDIDPNTGRFAYTGNRYVDQDPMGNGVGKNVVTDEHTRYEETHPDVFTVKVTDLSDPTGKTFTFQEVTVTHFGPLPRNNTASGGKKPIAIDLNGDGFHFTDIDDGNVFYDVNGDGWKRKIAWNNPADGFIAYDKDGDGKISHFDEISFVPYSPDGQTDLEGLRAFDTNLDGVFTAADAEWSKFGVWQDANSNGVNEAGEFRSLSSFGITQIGLTSNGQFQVINGQSVHGIGSATKADGSTYALADVTLRYRNVTTTTAPDGSTVTPTIAPYSAGQSFAGTSAADLVFGTSGSDEYHMDVGDDVVSDDVGDDRVDAGSGNDIVMTGAGKDYVDLGAGDDSAFTGDGDDLVAGGTGDDFISTGNGNDAAFGGDGNDSLSGGSGNDLLSGDEGNDKLFGEGGWDALFGMAGDDELWSGDGDDQLHGGAGNDLLAAGAGDDLMEGGLGNDTYEVDSAADIVTELAGEGFDTVRSSIDYTLAATLENLMLTGSAAVIGTGNAADNALTGNDGNNTLTGLAGKDTLDGGKGADTLVGGSGDDSYVVDNIGDIVVEVPGEGIDTLSSWVSVTLAQNVENLTLLGIGAIAGQGNALDNVIAGNGAANRIDGGAGADQMRGGDGNDTYVVENAGDLVVEAAGDGYDTVESYLTAYTLTAEVEALTLIGGAVAGTGNALANVIQGNAGANTLDGGAGDDVLQGLGGNNTYLFGIGDGHDLIVQYTDATAGKLNTLQFKAGILPQDVVASLVYNDLSKSDTDLELRLLSTGETVTVQGFFIDGDPANASNPVQQFRFANGAIWTPADALALTPVRVGTAGNDLLIGTAGNDTVSAGAGSDVVDGRDGNDRLFGGAGDDIVSGGNGDDALEGGKGNDTLSGGYGNNTYAFGRGDGQDLITATNDSWPERFNTLYLKAGIQPGDLIYRRVSASPLGGQLDLEISIAGTGDKITIEQFFSTAYWLVPIQALRFADGTVLDRAALLGMPFVWNGTPGGDYYQAQTGQTVIDGGDGDDILYSTYPVASTLVGGQGNDWLNGGAGDNTYDGGAGDDALEDRLGVGGNNTYAFGRGDGQDRIVWTMDSTVGRLNKVLFKAGVLPSDVVVRIVRSASLGVNAAFELSIAGTSDKITIDAFQPQLAQDSVYNQVQCVAFADGTVWNLAQVAARAVAPAMPPLALYGTAAAENLAGGGGNDEIVGAGGNDTLDGAAGNDWLDGGVGNNTYLFGRGDGQDVVSSYDTTLGKLNTLLFKAGVLPSDIRLRQVHGGDIGGFNSLELSIVGTTDKIVLRNFFNGDPLTSAANPVQQVRFSNGVTWTIAMLQSLVLTDSGGADRFFGNPSATTLNGGAGDDLLVGGNAGSLLLGGAGNDDIVGSIGNDTLDGGSGNDLLEGHQGNDTYQFGRGDGHDIIAPWGAGTNNVLQFKTGVLPTDITVRRLDDNGSGSTCGIEFSIVGTTDTITVEGVQIYGSPATITAPVSSFRFANGVVWDLNTLLAMPGIQNGSAGADTLWGSTGNESVNGANGDDLVFGARGNDVLGGGAGNDILYGDDERGVTGGDDVLDGGAGIDIMVGGTGNDVYVVDNAADAIDERPLEGTDTVQSSVSYVLGEEIENLTLTGATAINGTGNAVANVITGNGADNILDGGAGVDTLVGGLGNDTYVVDNASDVVTEAASAGTDLVQAGASYTLGANVENLTLVGPAAIYGTGNTLANVIIGNVENNVLDGGAGNDTLVGGLGNDTYVVDTLLDVVTEAASAGTDTVQTGLTYTLGANIENLTLTGGTAINGTGNTLNNTLTGNGADNVLDGGAGIDTLVGGLGNDTYIVDNAADVVTEAASAGTDLVQSGVTYILGANVENLTLTGASAINGTGNTLANALTGNGADNVLDGGTGIDTLAGGLGNDTYVVDNAADVVTEAASAGTDLVQSSIAWTLGANLENLTLTGSAAVNATGNTLANVLTGNGANNVLDGGAGADTLVGGLGNDTYVVDTLLDVITEAASAGTDLVQTGLTYTLGANVENLTLTGAAAINGTGNTLANAITGNSADNVLDGGAGIDTLAGGLGNDTYLVDTTTDVVTEAAGAGTDLVQASATYTLGANVENLILVGAAAINGTGNTLANVVTGNAANNVLDGGAGADTLIGGLGNDTYVVDTLLDVVTEAVGEGTDTIQTALTYTLGAEVENLTLTGAAVVNGTGNTLANVITGNGANNVLDGGAGIDTLVGGLGNDTYVVDNAADVVTEAASAGTDLVQSGVTYTLAANVENLTLTGASAINGTGNTLANALTGNAANNVLDGGTGIDTLVGGLGNDTYVVDNAADVVTEAASAGTDLVQSSIAWTLGANLENLTLTGSAAVNATGNTLANVITGNGGANRIDGGTGIDTMIGGAGNDTYVVDVAGDVVTELAAGGTDTIEAAIGWTLAAEVENLLLTGAAAINGTGNVLNNVLTGNGAANRLDGGAGNDTMVGGAGNDTYVVDSATDVTTEIAAGGIDTVESSIAWTLGTEVENLLLTGSAAVRGTGNTLANVITGNAGDNLLDGGAGNDTLVGGLGNDTYVVDTLLDVVTEAASAGTDTVQTGITYTLGANVENLTLTGAAVVNGTGNTLANVITGNGANNVLDGGAGIDTLVGGLGNDTYIVDNTADVVTEAASAGTDLVQSGVTYTLAANVENLTLTGATAINGTGNTLANALTGNAANNVLDGGTGIDTLAGGLGNDTYVVDNAADVVTEAASAGTDLVQSSIAWTLGANLENLTLTGSAAVNATGNTLANVITGNGGANRIDGGTGIDTMIGGAGNDTYVVDVAGDVVTELAAGGTDTIEAAIGWTLAAEVENLLLTGAAAINGTGNVLNNVLTGNGADNVLDGAAGIDTLVGGLGNDTYIVDNAADVVTEAASAGTDLVQSGVTYTLAANVENLTLTGATAINGTGNTLANAITGNGADNVLDGGTGIDTLVGGLGNDTYVVDNAADVVTEAAGAGTDTVQTGLAYVLGTNVENLLLTGAAAVAGTGNTLANLITGNGADNSLDGGAGADTLVGGLGNDTYAIDNAGDLVTELAGQGTDKVNSSINYVLAANVEQLTLIGTALLGTGNTLDNLLFGNALDNVLDGAAGADQMTGGLGDDRYVVGSAGDLVVEALNAGNDTAVSSITYVLPANVENVILVGTAAINATGNGDANVVVGNDGNNVLSGGAGNDVLAGGLGNDTLDGGANDDLYLYNQGEGRDIVTDASGVDTVRFGAGITINSVAARMVVVGGQNRIFVSILAADGTEQPAQGLEFAVASGIERFEFADGSFTDLNGLMIGARTQTGDALNNTLTGDRSDDTINTAAGNDLAYGRWGNDTLDGAAGNDTLFGEGGNDRLVGGTEDDKLWGGAGDDYLDAGSGTNQLMGGTGNDQLVGGNGFDVLDAGAGNDTLLGSVGEDQLFGDAGNDTLDGGSEADLLAAGGGDDVIHGGIGVNVVVAGSGNDTIDTGTDRDFIDAGAGADVIVADFGSDFIAAGLGNDSIDTGGDQDVIAFNRGDGADTVVGTGTDRDTLSLGGGIRYADLTLRKSGNDLIFDFGLGDSIAFTGWYTSSARRSVDTLQVVTVGGDYNSGSSSRMMNRKVVSFDFGLLANRFDQLLAATPGMTSWAVAAELDTYFKANSDTQAIGGDLANRYATTGSYGDLAWTGVRTQLGGMNGTAWQTLATSTAVNPWTALQAGVSLIADQTIGLPSPITPMTNLTPDQLGFLALNAAVSKPGWMPGAGGRILP